MLDNCRVLFSLLFPTPFHAKISLGIGLQNGVRRVSLLFEGRELAALERPLLSNNGPLS
jgi:hypothetical protein